MSASILSVAGSVGYPTLALLVLAESAGIPLPGETALITGGVLAGEHRLQIAWVIVIAAGASRMPWRSFRSTGRPRPPRNPTPTRAASPNGNPQR